MRNMMLRGLGLVAMLAAVGCGGAADDAVQTDLSEQEQQLPRCLVDEPKPCPDGYYCDMKTCRPLP
ncbi:hypothetical protein LZ198_08030 [Myxococcus sp. K15C18031901]|uniref:hypothetical protein n=1 Tax=Myxococcus dinghuensis TaxID=2906761 RepID=UPI0020A827A6|nr:hypothetical protein [Myxococcus dinghuensis]MCP3098822.1 hypothetical protein [Myxococcus dinghuensis]